MLSFRNATQTWGVSVSVKGLATLLNKVPPISVRELLSDILTSDLDRLPIVEETVRIGEDGIIYVKTDNPQLQVTTQLIQVYAEWQNRLVPQELTCQAKSWQFNNGDLHFDTWDGEEDATTVPSQAGSLSDKLYAWPATEGQWSGDNNDKVTLFGRGIRVGYKPITVRLSISKPKLGLAENSGKPFQIALDPEILLVPVEVVCFRSPTIRMSTITSADQLMLWDQVPIIGPTTNLLSIESTGEIRSAARAWKEWPKLSPEGLYEYQSYFSPDSVWGKAGVRFRLVNYIEIETDNAHVAPTRGSTLSDDSILRENHSELQSHPRHISDRPILQVIIMHRIAPPDAPEIGRALLGRNSIGVAWGESGEKSGVIAHEIGHLIMNSQSHSNLPNNVMNDPGPGPDITSEQIEAARRWARGFSNFWQRP